MNLRARLDRLANRIVSSTRVQAVAIGLPDGLPDLALLGGEWMPTDDVQAILAAEPPCKVYVNFDPRTL